MQCNNISLCFWYIFKLCLLLLEPWLLLLVARDTKLVKSFEACVCVPLLHFKLLRAWRPQQGSWHKVSHFYVHKTLKYSIHCYVCVAFSSILQFSCLSFIFKSFPTTATGMVLSSCVLGCRDLTSRLNKLSTFSRYKVKHYEMVFLLT